MTRFSKWTMLSGALVTIFAGATLVNGTTRYVPNQYSTIQAAINASAAGDNICITASYNDPGFNITKASLSIYSYSGQYNVNLTGLAQISNHVNFNSIYFSSNNNTRDLIQINSGNWYITFWNCLLNQGGNSAKSCVYIKGSDEVRFYNTTFLQAGYGIFAANTRLLCSQESCSFLWINRPIYYSNSTTGTYKELLVDLCSFTQTSTSNAYCVSASFPGMPNGSYGDVSLGRSSFSASGSGSVPIALAGHCSASIGDNTFYACPVPPGKEWSKTSSDRIYSATGNTAASGSNCTAGSY